MAPLYVFIVLCAAFDAQIAVTDILNTQVTTMTQLFYRHAKIGSRVKYRFCKVLEIDMELVDIVRTGV